GLFATTLNTPANERIIVPNAAVTGGTITNYTVAGTLRATISVGVAYGADIDQVKELLLAAANSVDTALEDPAPAVVFVDIAASSLNFNVTAWAPNDDFFPMMQEFRRACYTSLNQAGIDIPFDQLVIHQA